MPNKGAPNGGPKFLCNMSHYTHSAPLVKHYKLWDCAEHRAEVAAQHLGGKHPKSLRKWCANRPRLEPAAKKENKKC